MTTTFRTDTGRTFTARSRYGRQFRQVCEGLGLGHMWQALAARPADHLTASIHVELADQRGDIDATIEAVKARHIERSRQMTGYVYSW